jgi:uncharacterized repeat protein (TIGR02543 family)
MTKFSKEGLRFIIGILIGFLTLVVATSVLVSGFRELAKSISEITPGGSTPIEVEKETYRIDFNVMGGTLSGSSFLSVEEGKSVTAFPAATKQGFVFLGWFTGITPSDVLFTSSVAVNQDMTLFARWAETGSIINTDNPTYRITYNVMGGTLSGASFLTVEEGKFVLSFPAASKEGYDFLGWFTGITPNDVLFTSNIPVVQDLTLFARWQEVSTQEPVEPGVETFRVAFESDGGQPVNSIQVRHNGTISLPSVSRFGYVFLGWVTGYLPGDVLFTSQTQVTRNITLYALWERESFMITFIGNGGSFTQPLVAKATSNIEAPVSPKLLNHQFDGWYKDQALTEQYEFDTMPISNLTLYAKFSLGTDEGVEYTCSTTSCTISGFEPFHTKLTIPELKNGLPITSIADFAFRNANRLASITFLGNDIISIGKGAFEDASLLSEFVLPTSVEVIKDGAFKNASSLLSFDILSNISSIGIGILQGADSLRSITVPLFGINPSLQPMHIKYYFGGTTFSSQTSVPISLSKVTITEGNTAIPNDAFRDVLTLKEVHLPQSITSVGTNVLTGTLVEKLTWTFTGVTDGSVNSYLSYAFGNIHAVATNVPNTLKSVTLNETPYKSISSYAFYNIASLEEIIIPDSFTVILPFAFAHAAAGTSRLQQITLPKNLTAIGNNAFQHSSKLQSLVIPETVTTLGTNILFNTVELNSLTIGGQIPSFLRFYFGGTQVTVGGAIPAALKHVTITNTTNTLFPEVYFHSFTSLETISLPNSITAFGNYVFYNTTNLKSVRLPENLETLGIGAFELSGIETVVIPSKVTVLGNDAFRNAPRLTSITLPNGLLTIGNAVFYNSFNLRSLTIPSSVTSIGTDMLNTASAATPSRVESLQLNFESLPVSRQFLRYLFGGTSATVTGVLPNGLKTVNLTSTAATVIPNGFFQNFVTIETITLSNTFTSMGSDVFNGTTLLRNVTLPTGLTNIGVNAFLNSTALATINIPNTVTTFGNNAFMGTSGLTSIKFPESLVSLGIGVFRNSGLITVTIPEVITTIPTDTFFGASNLLDVTMHNGITSIETNAFRGTKITSISLSNQLTTIQGSAFRDLVGLQSITIPSSVTTIGIDILTAATALESITLHIDSLPVNQRFFRYLFGGTTATASGILPTTLKTVTLNSTAQTIVPTSFFQNFNTIETISLSDTFTSMGTDVFNGTTLLETVKLPKDITSLPNNTFFGSGLRTFTVPTPVTLIGNSVFQNALRLTTVVVPGTVTSLGINFLTGTTSLQTLTLAIDTVPVGANQHLGYIFGLAQTTGVRPTALKTVTLNSNAQQILPVSYFHLFASIETVNLDAKFNNIQNSAFFGTTSLENFELPVGLTTLGTNVFQNSGLKTVVIPEGITSIPNDTFNNATRLTSATLHNNITRIGDNAFFGTKITTINLTNQLLSIGNGAFWNATELTSLNIPSSVNSLTVTNLGGNIIGGANKLETLTLNMDSLPAARRDLRYLFGGTSSIAGGTMPTALKTVTLNSTTVTVLTQSFFQGFNTIETVNLSDTFTTMGTNLFNGATLLKTVKLPVGLLNIGDFAFTATGLVTFTVPASVTAIGTHVFASANSLTSLTIPATVTSIGANLISSANNLQTLTFHIDSMPIAVRYLRHFVGGTAASGGVLPLALKTVNVNSANVTSLPSNFFNGFNTVETINLSNTFTSFGVGVFVGASALKNLVLPNALTNIDNDTFSGAVALTKVVIPQTVTALGVNALRGMNQNVEIYFEGALPTINTATTFAGLFGTNTGVKVYVLQANLDAFKTVIAFNDLVPSDRLLTFTPGE